NDALRAPYGCSLIVWLSQHQLRQGTKVQAELRRHIVGKMSKKGKKMLYIVFLFNFKLKIHQLEWL
ncbi:MAG: hypothetical protein ACJA2G_003173, partial [Cognaticolwellia sp.]